MKKIIIIIFALFAIIGFFILRWQRMPGPDSSTTKEKKQTGSPLTVSILRNATYHSRECGTITLSNGRFQGGEPTLFNNLICSISLLDMVAFGDLDGDGLDDAAAFLGADFSGSGFFVSVNAVLNKNGGPRHIASVSFEDRIKIDAVRIEAGIIHLNATVHSAAAPMCCPDSLVQWNYRLVTDSLIQISN